jgi:outer membrane biosynthesis protein TonB
MRIPIAALAVVILCDGSAVYTQTAPDSSPQGPSTATSDELKPQVHIDGVEVLSDTQGVDFKRYLIEWHRVTEATWQPLIPKEANPPVLESGKVVIRFKILPNGQLMDGSLLLEGHSGYVALDRAAWGAITSSDFPRLPEAFKGPFLELRAPFLYNKKSAK